MRKLAVVLSLLLALALPAWGLQQAMSEEDYDATMKDVRATVGNVEGHVEVQSGAEVAADGKALAELFERVETFWKARGTDDAAGRAGVALKAARDLETAGTSGNFEAAGAALGELRGTCRGCHTEYRERTENGFRIKSGS